MKCDIYYFYQVSTLSLGASLFLKHRASNCFKPPLISTTTSDLQHKHFMINLDFSYLLPISICLKICNLLPPSICLKFRNLLPAMVEQENKMKLKLLVDRSGDKVVFAEAGKDFVDFLFHIMSLPVGTIVKLIGSAGMEGSVADLYKSIASLDNNYMQEHVEKDIVLNPKCNVSVPLLLVNESPKLSVTTKRYKCTENLYSSCSCSSSSVTNDPTRKCWSCRVRMSTGVNYLHSESDANKAKTSSTATGYVKGFMTYMVTDNLEVQPMSTISAITLLNTFHVRDIGTLVEKEVQIGFSEGVDILKASLETKTVLSTVFLGRR